MLSKTHGTDRLYRSGAFTLIKLCCVLFAIIIVLAGCVSETTQTNDGSQDVGNLIASIDPQAPETLSVPEQLIEMGR